MTSEKAYLQLQVESFLQQQQQQIQQQQLQSKISEDKSGYVNIDMNYTKKRSKYKSDEVYSRLKPMSSLVENTSNINRTLGNNVIGAANFLDSMRYNKLCLFVFTLFKVH